MKLYTRTDGYLGKIKNERWLADLLIVIGFSLVCSIVRVLLCEKFYKRHWL